MVHDRRYYFNGVNDNNVIVLLACNVHGCSDFLDARSIFARKERELYCSKIDRL